MIILWLKLSTELVWPNFFYSLLWHEIKLSKWEITRVKIKLISNKDAYDISVDLSHAFLCICNNNHEEFYKHTIYL